VLPDRLSRPAVRLFSRSAATDPEAAVRAFLVAMTWGYGRLGYGPFLGPAFGTKFLYFCSPPGRGALILDRMVANWLRTQTGLSLNQVRWSSQTYARYLGTMAGWADQLSVTADELETCIFSDQARPPPASGLTRPADQAS
jgi:hypothetical protein